MALNICFKSTLSVRLFVVFVHLQYKLWHLYFVNELCLHQNICSESSMALECRQIVSSTYWRDTLLFYIGPITFSIIPAFSRFI